MSWFSDLAGRAEALLNQVDQVAAKSLQEAGIGTPSPRKQRPIPDEPSLEFTDDAPPVTSSPPAYQPSFTPRERSYVDRAPPSSPIGRQPRTHSVTRHKESTNEHLTPTSSLSTWGNSAAWSQPPFPCQSPSSSSSSSLPMSSSKLPQTTSTPSQSSNSSSELDSISLSRPSFGDTSNVTRPITPPPDESDHSAPPSNELSDHVSSPALLEVDLTSSTLLQTDHSERPDNDPSLLAKEMEGCLDEQESGSNDRVKVGEEEKLVLGLKQKISNLEAENGLLRQEVQSLSVEISSVLHRNEKSREMEALMKSEVTSLRHQASQTDTLLRQMRSEIDDLTAALDAREAQNSVLKNRLEEADRQLELLKREMEESVKERERLLHDASCSSEVSNQALSSIKAQLNQAKAELVQQQEDMTALRAEFNMRGTQFETDKEQYSQTILSLQHDLQRQQFQYAESQKALMAANRDIQVSQREHEDYKQRAAAILQAKDKVIASLQNSSGGGEDDVKHAAMEESKAEKKLLQDQLLSSQQLTEEMRSELKEVEDNFTAHMEQFTEQMREKEEELEEERHSHNLTQEELQSIKQELDKLKNAHVEEKAVLVTQIRDKETEILALRAKSASVSSPGRETEKKLHSLTETLIEKQILLEKLGTERNSLQLQLEKTEAALASAEKTLSTRQQHTALTLGSEDEGSQTRPMSSILPLSSSSISTHHRRVKRALNAVDRISVHIGVVMRRYPYFRLFVILYVILLHVWVVVVLFTYRPEVHPEL